MDPNNTPYNSDNPEQPPLDSNPYPPAPPLFNDPPPPPPPQSGPGIPPPPGPPPAAPSGQYNNAPATPTGTLTKDERNWAMFAHLSALVAGVIAGFLHLPFLVFLAPLIIWLIKKDESVFVADQAKEALNFSITLGLISILMLIVGFLLVWTIVVPFLMLFAYWGLVIVAVILMIVAAVKASEGNWYRYPFTLRLIK